MANQLKWTAAALFLLAFAVLAITALGSVAYAHDGPDDSGGGLDVGRGGTPPPGTPPGGEHEADPDGHSINTEPWHVRDPGGAGSRYALFILWAREFLLLAILFGPIAGIFRSRL